MKKHNIIVYLLTAVFILVSVCVIICQNNDCREDLISFSVKTADATEEIDAWFNGEDKYYVFLPAYANLKDTRININSDCKVYLDGEILSDGALCDRITEKSVCKIKSNSLFSTNEREIVFLRSSNVHTMHIETNSGTMEYIHNDKKYEESATYSIFSETGDTCNKGTIAEIGGHGNTTWEEYDKKSYSITLEDSDSLLEMGEAQRWVLLANADDPSNIRNKFVYDFADDLGLVFSPDSEWVDLYLNGEYAGLYLLSERNEVHSERVATEGDNSFLVSAELDSRLKKQNFPFISTSSNQFFRVHYPETLTQSSADNIREIFESVERAVSAENGIDSVSGKHWNELIDVTSFARKYLIEEVFGNLDAGFISQYYYYDSSSPEKMVYAGPVWDYGYSMGNPYVWQLSSYESIYADRLNVKDGYSSPLFYNLMRDDVFNNKVNDIYSNEFVPLLSQYLDSVIPEYHKKIENASKLNQLRWFDKDEDVSTSINSINSYLTNRIDFLTTYWSDKDSYHLVCVNNVISGNYGYFAVRNGECFDELSNFDDIDGYKFCGWYNTATGEKFDASKPITEDVCIYADWQSVGSDSVNMLIKLIPAILISVVFIVLFVKDIRRTKGYVRNNER